MFKNGYLAAALVAALLCLNQNLPDFWILKMAPFILLIIQLIILIQINTLPRGWPSPHEKTLTLDHSQPV